ncbi:MAG: hypothetical protein HY644_06530 [Acidobacteria bacterium]|nr:hypothetical protein [Acidobacteriota bacterium]
MRRAIGTILVVAGLGFYSQHLGEGGGIVPSHVLWLLIGGVAFFIGFWLSVPDSGRRSLDVLSVTMKIIGILLALVGISFSGWHLAERGDQPHFVWGLLGAVIFFGGLLLVFPESQRRLKRRSN